MSHTNVAFIILPAGIYIVEFQAETSNNLPVNSRVFYFIDGFSRELYAGTRDITYSFRSVAIVRLTTETKITASIYSELPGSYTFQLNGCYLRATKIK